MMIQQYQFVPENALHFKERQRYFRDLVVIQIITIVFNFNPVNGPSKWPLVLCYFSVV